GQRVRTCRRTARRDRLRQLQPRGAAHRETRGARPPDREPRRSRRLARAERRARRLAGRPSRPSLRPRRDRALRERAVRPSAPFRVVVGGFPGNGPNTLMVVPAAALVTALATGLGALPFVFVGSMSRRWVGLSNAIASGFMLSASGALLIEGLIRGVLRVIAGAIAGAFLIAVTHRLIAHREDLQLGRLRSADATKAILIIGVMTLHSLSEGVGVGVSYGGGAELGVFITIAIAIHNIPEGLAISLVLVPRGATVVSAAWWSVFSSLPQPLIAPLAYLF